MNYLCVKCKQENDVSHIAINIADIVNKKAIETLGEIKKGGSDTEEELWNGVEKIINEPKRLFCVNGAVFAACAGKAKNKAGYPYAQGCGPVLVDAVETELGVIQGTLRLTVKQIGVTLETVASKALKVPAQLTKGISTLKANDSVLFEEPVTVGLIYPDGETPVVDYIMGVDGFGFSDAMHPFKGYERVCDCCGRKLPRTAGRAEELVIGLMGSPRAGKTSMITAMVSELERQTRDPGRPFGGVLQPLRGCPIWEQFNQAQLKWYERGYKVEKTQTEIEEPPVYSVLLQTPAGGQKVYTFVDMPGEFWTNGDGLNGEFFDKYGDLYRAVDCIWILISKGTVLRKKVLDVMGREDADEAKRAGMMEMFQKTADEEDVIRNANEDIFSKNLVHIKQFLGEKLPPIAFILSKQESVVDGDEIPLAISAGLFPGNPVGTEFETRSGRIREQDKTDLVGCFENTETGEKILAAAKFREMGMRIAQYIKTVNHELLAAIQGTECDYMLFSAAAYGREAQGRPWFDDPKAPNNGQADNERARTGKKCATAEEVTRENIEILKREPEDSSAYHAVLPLLWTMGVLGGYQMQQNVHVTKRRFLTPWKASEYEFYKAKLTLDLRTKQGWKAFEPEAVRPIEKEEAAYSAICGMCLKQDEPQEVVEITLGFWD